MTRWEYDPWPYFGDKIKSDADSTPTYTYYDEKESEEGDKYLEFGCGETHKARGTGELE